MASELKVDKFTGVTTAGSILVTGEGNSTTTNLQQGLAKFWAGELSHANDTAEDTFNNSSLTNIATGKIGCNFTNNMSNNDCSVTYSCSGNYPYQGFMNGTTQVQHLTVNSANSFADGNGGLAIHGDLA